MARMQGFAYIVLSTLLLLLTAGCDFRGNDNATDPIQPASGGGGVPLEMVTIEGKVDDGQLNSPIADTICRVVTQDGEQRAQTIADASGAFRLDVPPNLQGFLECSPRLLPLLRLSTFVSTMDKVPGDTIAEEVSPKTTVVAELLTLEAPANPQARKEELLAAIAAQEPPITALVNAATAMYKPLFEAQVNVSFGEQVVGDGAEAGESGGAASDAAASGGGVEGSADDGAEFSRIPNAACDFALSLDGEVFANTVLQDLFDNGSLDRPDLQAIAQQVNPQLAGQTAEIATAFAALFPHGIGRPLRVTANASGHYFLPVPPGTPGFVRCRPPNQDKLVLATFVRARQEDETLRGQDVTPQTTIFSTNVASKLADNLADTKENFLQDIAGLEVQVLGDASSPTGFVVTDPERVNDHDVGMVAFSSVALFNALLKNGVNVPFLDALNQLVTTTTVTPDFLVSQGLPADQAGAIAATVNTSTATAEAQLGTDLGAAFSTARLIVRVTQAPLHEPLQGVTVDIGAAVEGVHCQNCPVTTDVNGNTTLTFTGVPLENAVPITVTAALAGFEGNTATAEVVAFATVDANIVLTSLANHPPVASNDTYVVLEDSTLVVEATTGVLANDSDPDDTPADTLSATLVAGPAHGAVTLLPNGAFTYVPDPNYSGTDTFVYQVSDDGGSANGGNDTGNNATVTITVIPVNDAPSLTLLGAHPSVPENAGPQTLPGWAALSPGPPDEAAQTMTVLISNSNPALFAVQPGLDTTGTLTFTPAVNISGQATVTVHVHDDGGITDGGQDVSPAKTFTITVTAVNNAPSFSSGGNQVVLEDAGTQTVAGWATAISPGPADEAAQAVTFVVSNDTPGLFAVQPTITATGTLTYTPAANANGQATVTVQLRDDGGTANGGQDTSAAQAFTITVSAVNDAPSFALLGTNHSVPEDAEAQSVTGWATAMSAGPPDEVAQAITFVVSNDTPGLFAVQPTIAPTGTLTYTPAANTNGQATVTVQLRDDGDTANGGQDTSSTQTFTITVVAVNNPPSFTPGPDQTVLEDAGAQSVTGWATDISPGPPDEAAQTGTFLVSNDNNALFAVPPAIAPNGTLTYTPAANANGQASVTVQLRDNGGTAFGGQDTSPAETFTITMTAVNDAPSFTRGPSQVVLEDAGPQTEAGWATAISQGPPNEAGQTVTFVVSHDNAALFAAQPAVAADGTLTYTPAANTTGQATVTVRLQDNGGTANGGQDTSATQTFTISVVSVNEPPSFRAGPPQVVQEDAGAQTVMGWATDISPGPPDEAG